MRSEKKAGLTLRCVLLRKSKGTSNRVRGTNKKSSSDSDAVGRQSCGAAVDRSIDYIYKPSVDMGIFYRIFLLFEY